MEIYNNNKRKIIYLCRDTNNPVGGFKQIYRHVDILNNNGFDAYVCHEKPSFRCDWFENNTKIIYNKETFSKNDIIVIPELFTEMYEKYKNNRKVILNQGCYLTFSNEKLPLVILRNNYSNLYNNADITAIIVVSDDSKNYLSYCFPNKPIFRVFNGIDKSLFYYDKNQKKNVISFFCSKNSDDIKQIICILKLRNLLKGWELIPIYKKKFNEVAQILRESRIFLSFGTQEGFYLPAAEAMACGCVVLGYTGLAGREYFKNEFTYSVPNGDIVEFSKKIENIIIKFNKDSLQFSNIAEKASNFISENYSLNIETNSIIETWKSIVSL